MKQRQYTGQERRIRPINDRRCDTNCLEHSGLYQKVANLEAKTDHLESEGFLTSTAYRWTTGILVSILISILSATVYATFQASEALREVKAAQHTLSLQITYLRETMEELKKKVR